MFRSSLNSGMQRGILFGFIGGVGDTSGVGIDSVVAEFMGLRGIWGLGRVDVVGRGRLGCRGWAMGDV